MDYLPCITDKIASNFKVAPELMSPFSFCKHQFHHRPHLVLRYTQTRTYTQGEALTKVFFLRFKITFFLLGDESVYQWFGPTACDELFKSSFLRQAAFCKRLHSPLPVSVRAVPHTEPHTGTQDKTTKPG